MVVGLSAPSAEIQNSDFPVNPICAESETALLSDTLTVVGRASLDDEDAAVKNAQGCKVPS